MEIKIIPNMLAEVKLDLKHFKTQLKIDLNLEKAVLSSINILYRNDESLTNTEVLEAVYYNLNWGEIIDFLKDLDNNEMFIRIFEAEVIQGITYYPGKKNENNTHFILEVKEHDGKELILIQSFVKSIDVNLDNFIKTGIYDYSKEWKPI